MKRITVLGASGYTGKLICDLLTGEGIPFRRALRTPKDHSDLKVDVFNLEDIRTMLQETDVLINCVGPYNVLSLKVIEEVRKFPVYYLDLTGEQQFVKGSYDQGAGKATIVHSCSFESALTDLLCSKFLRPQRQYDFINSYYDFSSVAPSPGTRFTIKVHGHFKQYRVQNAELVECDVPFAVVPDFADVPAGQVALFTPYPEVIFINKRFKVGEGASFILMDKGIAGMAIEKSKEPKELLEETIKRNARMKPRGPSPEERTSQGFRLILEAKESGGELTVATLSGADMYGVTACLAVGATKILLVDGPPQGKVLSPAEAFFDHGLLEEVMRNFSMTLSSKKS